KCSGVLRDAIDPEFFCERVEENVARLKDRFADVDGPMHAMLGDDPAFEIASVERCAAVAVDMHVLSDLFLEPGSRHDDLENRSGGKLGLNGFIEQRMVVIIDEFVPLVF